MSREPALSLVASLAAQPAGAVPLLCRPILFQHLPARLARALRSLGAVTIGDLLRITPGELQSIPSCATWTSRQLCNIQRRLMIRIIGPGSPPAPGLQDEFDNLIVSLPTRTRNIMGFLKVRRAMQLVRLDLDRVCSLHRVGSRTGQAIATLQQKLWHRLLKTTAAETAKIAAGGSAWELPCSVEWAAALPLFGGGPVNPQRLHPSYCGNASVEELGLRGRPAATLARLGIRTVGELLCTPLGSLLKLDNFSQMSLQSTQDAVMDYLKEQNGLGGVPAGSLPLGSFAEFYAAVLSRCIRRADWRGVLQARLGSASRTPQTLSQIGKSLGLTRERVRQIQLNALAELAGPRSQRLLEPFLAVSRTYFKTGGGVAFPEEYAKALAGAFHWRRVPRSLVLAQLLKVCDPSYQLNALVIQCEHPCRQCADARRVLVAVKWVRDGRISPGEARDTLIAYCSSKCTGNPGCRCTTPSDAFLAAMGGCGVKRTLYRRLRRVCSQPRLTKKSRALYTHKLPKVYSVC